MIILSSLSDPGWTEVVLAALFGFAAGWWFLSRRIKERVLSSDIIDQLRGALSPQVIFDDAGAIVSEQGMDDILDSSPFEFERENKIVIRMSKLQTIPPILTEVAGHTFNSFTPNRVEGTKYDWEFELNAPFRLAYSEDETPPRRLFRLEVLT